jgi:hypothetical protein
MLGVMDVGGDLNCIGNCGMCYLQRAVKLCIGHGCGGWLYIALLRCGMAVI